MSKVTAGVELDDLTDEVSGLTYSVNDADKVLQKYGIFMTDSQGQMRDLGDVLDEVGGKWGTMTRLEQNQLSYVLAGARQRNIFTAAMNDWNTVLDAEQVALNSAGTAEEKMAVFTESLEAAQNKLTAAWQSFVTGTNIDKVFIAAYKAGTLFLNILDLLLNKIPVLSMLLRGVLLVSMTSVVKAIATSAATALKASKGIKVLGTIIKSVSSDFSFFGNLIPSIANIMKTQYIAAIAEGATTTQALGVTIASVASTVGTVLLPVLALAATAFVIWYNSVERAQKELDKVSQKVDETQSKISDLTSQIDTLNSSIDEMESKGTLTLTEQSDLERMKQQTAELKTQLAVQKTILENQKKEELSKATTLYNKQEGEDATVPSFGTMWNSAYGSKYDKAIAASQVNASLNIDKLIASYEELKKKEEEAAEAGKDFSLDTELTNTTTEMTSELSDAQSYITQYEDAISSGVSTTEAQDNAYELAKTIRDTLMKELSPEEFQTLKLSEIFGVDNFDSALTTAKEKVSSLQEDLTSGIIDKGAFDNQINDIATSLASDTQLKDALTEIFGTEAMDDFSSVVATIAEQLNNQLDGALGNTAMSMDEVNKSIDTIQSSFDTVNNAVEEYNQYGGLSADNLQAILGLSDEYIDALSIENGKLSVNGQAIDDIVQAKLEDAKVTATQQYMTELESIANGDAASSAAAATYATQAQGEASAELANVLGVTTGAVYNFANSNDLLSKYNAALKKDTNATAKATERYQKKLALINSTAQGSGSSFKKLSNVLGGYSASAQKASEKTQKLQTELKDSQKDVTNLLEMTEKMLKQQYEDQKKSLDDSLDAFEKKIDAQKELLDLQQKEEEHAKKIADYNKQIGDYQAQLAESQFDDSTSGQANKLKLLDSLNSAQTDLTDYQKDYSEKSQEDALSKQLSDYKEYVDEKKKYISDTLESEQNLYQEAIALIQGKTSAFYDSLIKWNRAYGDNLDSTVLNTWNLAYAALDKYGNGCYDVQSALEYLNTQLNEIEAQNRKIEQSAYDIGDAYSSATSDAYALADAAKQAAVAYKDLSGAKQEYESAVAQQKNAANIGKGATGTNGYMVVQKMPDGNGKTLKSFSSATSINPKNEAEKYLQKLKSSNPKSSYWIQKYHNGTNYVKPTDNSINKIFGLKPNEALSILKEGEAVVPDYANPANSRNVVSGSLSSRISNSSKYNDNLDSNGVSVSMGDIIIQGDATQSTVDALKAERKSIVQEMFATMNKHNIGSYRNIKIVST